MDVSNVECALKRTINTRKEFSKSETPDETYYSGLEVVRGRSSDPPSVNLRNLAAYLYPAFREHYRDCGCQEEHNVKFSLRHTYERGDSTSSLKFGFLFAVDQASICQEGAILVTSQRQADFNTPAKTRVADTTM